MDARLTGTAAMLFFSAYAGSTPLFSLFGTKMNIALALAILAAFSFESFYERAFLAFAAAAGIAIGVGFGVGLLFFGGLFAISRAVYRVVPWQPFLVGCVLVVFFSFLTYLSPDWEAVARLAPQFGREALYNLTVFAAAYLLMPPTHARHGRRY